MSLTNPKTVVTEERLSQFYNMIYPYLGGLPDIVANKFSKGDLYSTDEKMIGQWIDGKPLYQKSVNFGALPNKTSKTVSHGISNIDAVVKIDTIASRGSYNTWVQLPIVNDTNINYQCGMQVVGDNLTAESRNVDFSSFSAYVTIQYTKTTDSSISIGNDTDYSATEKIIGTWIDGKPLYQKTIDFGYLPNNTEKLVDIGISDYIIRNIYGIGVTNSGFTMPIPNVEVSALTGQIALAVTNQNKVRIITKADQSGVYAYITIQYTKTTD